MNFQEYLDIVNIDYKRIKLAKARQCAVFQHEKPDRWPLLVWEEMTPLQEEKLPFDLPDYQDYTFENRLLRWLRYTCKMVNASSDIVPLVYPDFGTYRWTECLGMKSNLTESGYWAPEPIQKDKLKKLDVNQIELRGRAKDSVDFIRYVKESIGDAIDIGCGSAQSPFGVADAIMGQDIFIEIYDSPDLVHHVMEVSLETLKRYVTWMKEAAGVPLNICGAAGGGMYAENFGLQISDDEAVLLSPQSIDEFSMPYLRRLAEYFGGASVHYCGRHDGLTKAVWNEVELKGINFGLVPGKEHDQPFEWVMEGCLASGTVSYSEWPIKDNESVKDYLRRLYGWASQGCLIPRIELPELRHKRDDGILKESRRLLDYWEQLHC